MILIPTMSSCLSVRLRVMRGLLQPRNSHLADAGVNTLVNTRALLARGVQKKLPCVIRAALVGTRVAMHQGGYQIDD
jgi:hypothetical protein